MLFLDSRLLILNVFFFFFTSFFSVGLLYVAESIGFPVSVKREKKRNYCCTI